MNDSISRETALKALEEISYGLWEIDIPSPTVPEYIEHHEQVQGVMKLVDEWARKIQAAMPVSEEPTEPQWTPCSERLPENDRDVLASTSWGTVEMAWLYDGNWRTDNFDFDDDDPPTAWMPLPEPFKDQKDG